MAIPQIPPRPSRSQHQYPPASTSMDAPKIPPRPQTYRLSERSQSPHRDSFAPSPLNEAPFTAHQSSTSSVYLSNASNSTSSFGLPQRPPSVSLPSIGQEGNEYADLEPPGQENAEGAAEQGSPTQTRNVGSDLPLHAPTPSLATSSAKARIATVTRTDSSQAAAVGIGKPGPPPGRADDKDSHNRDLRSKTSFTRSGSSASTERPASAILEGEHGIPEIGQRVPMHPNAGDVQAPSPSPFAQTGPTGIGFHNDGTQKAGRHHGRTRSGREVFHGPPGSYGLHGHGTPNTDKFEKAWYDKHPDALVREESGQYGPGIGGSRGEWALSSDDLNKIVRQTATRGAGFGTSPNIVGLPNEQIGYMASEEYASRMSSPRPQSASYHKKAHSNHSQTHMESPLRKASFPVDISGKENFDKSKDSHAMARHQSDNALESETEDDDVIHIDAPEVRTSKIGGNGYDPPTENLGPRGGNTEAEGGWIEERGYGVPILASDEIAKEPGYEYLQPAVSPAQERRSSTYYSGVDSDMPPLYQSGFRHGSHSGSASSSRPGSIHGSLPGLSRFISHDDREDIHTPLEDVEEYEPLFPEDENKTIKRLNNTADRFKQRPDIKRRFPSQDIWEDTPNSLQLQATVSTPEPELESLVDQSAQIPKTPSATFETPEAEAARKGVVSDEDRAKLIPKEERWAQSNFKPHLRDEMQRPGLKQRFPSRDIWEDSPDSARLETTVEGPQSDEIRSPQDTGLEAGAVVITSGRPDEDKNRGEQPREGATVGAPAVEKPSIPPRPVKSKHADAHQESASPAPPSTPARPSQRLHQVPPADIPSSKTFSKSPLFEKSVSSNEIRETPGLPARSKPQVPARPTKPATKESPDGGALAKTASATSIGSNDGSNDAPSSISKGITSQPPAPKPKPVIPSRPLGGKIAALKAGFLSDLDKRLQLGPQAPPKPQEKVMEQDEGEKLPLTDARKGRARGPARRKPAASPASEETKTAVPKLEIMEPWTVWQISLENNGSLEVPHATKASVAEATRPPTSASDSHIAEELPDVQSSSNAPDVTLAEMLEVEGPPGKDDDSKPIEDIVENETSIHIIPDDMKDSNLGHVSASSSKTIETPADITEAEVSTREKLSTEDTAADEPVKPDPLEVSSKKEQSTVPLKTETETAEVKVEVD